MLNPRSGERRRMGTPEADYKHKTPKILVVRALGLAGGPLELHA